MEGQGRTERRGGERFSDHRLGCFHAALTALVANQL